MKNLLKETIDCLINNSKQPSDVLWVGMLGYDYDKHKQFCYRNTWGYFCSKADFTYHDGFGGVEIDMGLIVVGKNFWLERHAYDGSEWWEFKSIPMEPEETIEFDLRADDSF